jgi:hypothetical protein
MTFRPFVAAALALLAGSVAAKTITFPVGTPIYDGTGIDGWNVSRYVEKEGFRFEAPGRVLSINDYVGGGRVAGGLVDSSAFGVAYAMTITRIDGKPFSFKGLRMFDHVGFACYQNFCGLEGYTAAGYVPGSTIPVHAPLRVDGYNNTYDSFKFLAATPQFAGLTKAVLVIDESFILDSVTVGRCTAPIPECGAP